MDLHASSVSGPNELTAMKMLKIPGLGLVVERKLLLVQLFEEPKFSTTRNEVKANGKSRGKRNFFQYFVRFQTRSQRHIQPTRNRCPSCGRTCTEDDRRRPANRGLGRQKREKIPPVVCSGRGGSKRYSTQRSGEQSHG